MASKTITLHFERETKGTVRYDERGVDRPFVQYLEKSRFFTPGQPYPPTVKITVDV